MKNGKGSRQVAFFASVAILSVITGISIYAWTEPEAMPPTGSVGVPINTGGTEQTKQGKLNAQGGIGWGSNGAVLNSDQGASIELRGNNTPYIDISNDGSADFDARFILINNDKVSVDGADLNANARLCIKDVCCGSWSECLALAYDDPGSPQFNVTPFAPTVGACNTDLSAKNLRVFVTSSAYTGYQVSNVGQADTICQNTASAYGVPGTYRALMYYGDGTTQRNPMSVLAPDARYWNGGRAAESDPNCTWYLVADNPNDFLTDSGGNYLDNPITYNEKGLAISNTVWTNFSATGMGNWDGLPGYNGSLGCTGVCAYVGGYVGYNRRGHSAYKNSSWNNYSTSDIGTCADCMSQSRAIYCVQQRGTKDNVAGPCSVTLPTGHKKIFVTSKTYTGYQVSNAGQADAICATHASRAQMAGTYKALMYYGDGTLRNPYDVLASGSAFWNCGTDGDLVTGTYVWKSIASSPSEFFTADGSGNYLDNPIKYDEMGKPTDSGVTVWTNFAAIGSGNWDGLAGNNGTLGCTGVCGYVSGYVGYTRRGNSFSRNSSWANYATDDLGTCEDCMSQSRAIYCVEQ